MINFKKLAKYPDKKRINLYPWKMKKRAVIIQLSVFAAVMALIYAFVRFGVIGLLEYAEQAELSYYRMDQQLLILREENRAMREVSEEYAHYGKGYQNEEEKAVPDRLYMLDMLKSCVFPYTVQISSVSIKNDGMEIFGTLPKETEFAALLRQIELDERVRYVFVFSEAAAEGDGETEVHFTVYFKQTEESRDDS